MAVELYFCQNCDYQTETYSTWNGFGCPKCYSHLRFGVPAPSDGSVENRESVQSRRARRKRRKPRNEAERLYMKFNRELLELRESEELHYMERRRRLHEEDVVRKEAFKRKTEQAPVVFHAFRTTMTEELDENERLFSGAEVSTYDPLETPDYQDDSAHLERDLVDDIPFGELIAPSSW